jgi:hypothetical protein
MSKMIHMRIDIRGALMNWHDSEWKNCVTDETGRTLTPTEVKRGFLDELAKGNNYVSTGNCDNFDPKEGCLGHADPQTKGESDAD